MKRKFSEYGIYLINITNDIEIISCVPPHVGCLMNARLLIRMLYTLLHRQTTVTGPNTNQSVAICPGMC